MEMEPHGASPRWPGSREADEAVDLRAVAEALRGKSSLPIDTREVRWQIAAVLSAVGQELYNGRVVPLSVRRASGGLARAVRLASEVPPDGGV